jgi:predicted metal-dependent peptidase
MKSYSIINILCITSSERRNEAGITILNDEEQETTLTIKEFSKTSVLKKVKKQDMVRHLTNKDKTDIRPIIKYSKRRKL